MEIFVLKPLVVGKLGLFSGIQNDALMHRESLKGSIQRRGCGAYVERLTASPVMHASLV